MTAPKIVGLDVSDWPMDKTVRFVSEFSSSIHTGDGRIPAFSDRLGVDGMYPLRILLGIPRTDHSAPRKRFTEAFLAYFLDAPPETSAGLAKWTTRPSFAPINPRRTPAPVSECVLDWEFVESLGLRPKLWEQHVFLTPVEQLKKGGLSRAQVVRAYLALSMFGFSRPEQFFILP